MPSARPVSNSPKGRTLAERGTRLQESALATVEGIPPRPPGRLLSLRSLHPPERGAAHRRRGLPPTLPWGACSGGSAGVTMPAHDRPPGALALGAACERRAGDPHPQGARRARRDRPLPRRPGEGGRVIDSSTKTQPRRQGEGSPLAWPDPLPGTAPRWAAPRPRCHGRGCSPGWMR